MTSPLREMTAAARAMAQGDYSRRVRATSRDEVGQLAAAFNPMAEDLAAADRQRRELIANVSHELRTPITALQGVLENIVDGVAEADPDTLKTALAQTERLGRLVTELLDLSRLDAGVLPLARDADRRAALPGRGGPARRTVNADGAGRDVRFVVVRAEPGGARRPGAAAPGPGQPAGQRGPAQPAGRHGARSAPSGRTTGCCSRSATRARASRRPTASRVFERFTRGEPGRRRHRARPGHRRWVSDARRHRIAVLDSTVGCRIRVTLPAAGHRRSPGIRAMAEPVHGRWLAIARWVVQSHHGTIAVADPVGERRGCHIHVTPRVAARLIHRRPARVHGIRRPRPTNRRPAHRARHRRPRPSRRRPSRSAHRRPPLHGPWPAASAFGHRWPGPARPAAAGRRSPRSRLAAAGRRAQPPARPGRRRLAGHRGWPAPRR